MSKKSLDANKNVGDMDEMTRLQKKLIPLNIVVCVITLTAILSLLLAPMLTIDIGKIISDESTLSFVDKALEDKVGEGLEENDKGDIDYTPVVSRIVKNVMGSAQGKIELSAIDAMKVAMAPEDQKAKTVLDQMFFGEKGLVTNLIDSIVDGVGNMFETTEGKQLIEETLVTTMVSSIVKENEELADKLTESNVKELTDAFKKIEEVKDGDVSEVAADICAGVEKIMGEPIDEETKQELETELKKLYDATLEAVNADESVTDKKVTMENIICVTASSNIDLGEINISEMLAEIFQDDGDKDEIKKAENEESDEEHTGPVVTTYTGLLEEMGFGEEEREQLKTDLKEKLNSEVDKLLAENDINEYVGYYKYLFYFMLIFMVLWGILFLFAFIHIFTKNKRFCMWYVKLLCWIPSLVWLVLKLLPVILAKFAADMFEGDDKAIMDLLFKGITSFTWINGLCYVLLWLVSIFWAFPIKHKIRKLRSEEKAEARASGSAD